jgi:hypothetical protein
MRPRSATRATEAPKCYFFDPLRENIEVKLTTRKNAVPGPGNPAYAAGTGSTVTDLIFSIAKREVTFFSGTAPISFL